MKKRIAAFVFLSAVTIASAFCHEDTSYVSSVEVKSAFDYIPEPTTIELTEIEEVEVVETETEQVEYVEPTKPVVYNPSLFDWEIELIALVTMAEAEGEPEEGKRWVIDVILNRVESDLFPDSVYDVIYERGQFEAMWNGRSDRCYVSEDICQLVREELQSRTNYEALYFRTGHYHSFGEPIAQIGNHYFSTY